MRDANQTKRYENILNGDEVGRKEKIEKEKREGRGREIERVRFAEVPFCIIYL